jgi:acyl dehydratase
VTTRTLDQMPGIPGLYAKALTGALPGPLRSRPSPVPGSPLPDPVRVDGVQIDPSRLAAYRDVCGFGGDSVPATFPHVLAFPLHLTVMTDPSFPFATLGVVHIDNTITQSRPLLVDEPLDLIVSCSEPRPHPRGRQIALVTQAEHDGERVWRSESVMLSRGPATAQESDRDSTADDTEVDLPVDAPTGPQLWHLQANLGRRYAGVSADRNPIHLYDLTAKPFGFSRHIAHGMWTKARCLAELHNRLPDEFSVTVAFRKPVTLPGAVRFGARASGPSLDFAVTSPTTGSIHLLGRVKPVDRG